MKFDLPKTVKKTLDTILANGYKAYIVGGCVRDLLCGKVPHDYDIATDATPQEIKSLFSKTVDTGIKHGTVTVIADGEPIEVTTFRTEGSYSDSRHPESVSFVSDITKDLARRDFTVNAMCYNDIEGLIDCFGGTNDIKSKTLRTVGDAKTRFNEDALRILRLFRFSATLDFKIEKQTFDSAKECAHLLKNISAERIFAELKKAAMGNNITAVCPLLETNALENYCLKSGDLNGIKDLDFKENLRTFALLNLTSLNLARTLESLKCSNDFKDYCFKMNSLSQGIISADKASIKRALNFAYKDIVYDILSYYKHILKIDVTKHLLLLDEIFKNGEPYKISQLALSGSDLLNLGVKGKDIGEKLDFLLNTVITHPEYNSRDKLLNLICN